MSQNIDLEDLKVREKNVKNLEKIKTNLEKKYQEDTDKLNVMLNDILTEKDNRIVEKKKKITEVEKLLSDYQLKLSNLELEYKTKLASSDDNLKKSLLERQTSIITETSKRFDKYIKDIEIENKKIIDNLSKFLEWNAGKFTDEFDKLTSQYESLLLSKDKLREAEIKNLAAANENLNSRLGELSKVEALKLQYETETKILALKTTRLNELIDRKVEEKYKDVIQELKNTKTVLSDHIEKYQNISMDYVKLQNEYLSTANINAMELKTENENLLRKMQEIVSKYGVFTESSFEEIKKKADLADKLEKNVRDLKEECSKLSNQLHDYKVKQANTDALTFIIESQELTIKTERALLKKLKEDLDNLESRLDNTKNTYVATEAIEAPIDDFRDLIQNKKESLDEINWIESIIESCTNSGFKFSKRLFYSFHTCLKTNDMSPLTVLAGVSGTGKSKLPQLYARFGGFYFLSLPVQPDWDSPQSLFGYFNSIEKRFNATTLLRSLVSFQADKSLSKTKDNILNLSDNLLIVLLDEMNLAHIELYFSDFLSKLEEKRGESKETYVEIDLGAGNGKYKVYLTNNVIWVGTMNEDETTKSLSDKVIDRGNVISFPRPRQFEMYRKANLLEKSNDKIKRKVWDTWISNKADIDANRLEYYMNIVVDINNHLRVANRALGHRVWQSIHDYIISHPLVVKYQKDETKLDKVLTYAFEEALVHKVMTKLRGIETDGELLEKCLSPIEEIITEKAPSLKADYMNAQKSITGTFVWDSADYLEVEYTLD